MKLTIALLLAVIVAGLAACASHPKEQPAVIPAFQNNNSANPQNAIRLAAIRDTATSIGAQGALAWRGNQIDHMLHYNSRHLDHIFDFNAMLLKNNVLPPVLVEGQNAIRVTDDANSLRLADRVYKIVTPPQFVTAAPNWRQYLWMSFQKPAPPNATLLPQTPAERVVWNTSLQQGWQQGLVQANQIFSTNLGRLKRDYNGMVLYHELLMQKMVSAPFIASAKLGVTGGGNQLRVGDQVLRITATSQLDANSSQWKPVLYNQVQLPKP